MPMYTWENQKTKETRDVVASMADRDIPPDDSGDWIRVLAGKVVVHKTNAWGFGKGYYNSKTPGRGRQ